MLFLLQISFVVCGNNSIEENEGHIFVNYLIHFCKDYFGGQVVISLPPYHGKSYRNQSQGTFAIRSVQKMRQILKAFWFKELLISGRRFVFVYVDTDNTIVKPDAEYMCCKLSSYIIYLQNNVNSYFYVYTVHGE